MARRVATAAAAAWKGGAKAPSVAIAGATGAVGQDIMKVLSQRGVPLSNLKLLASSRSAGSTIVHEGVQHTVQELTADSFHDVDIALFSAGGGRSEAFAPAAVQAGAVVIDNSSAFRMHPDVPLVVPEVNPADALQHSGIIANPNCSTILLALPLAPLHRAAGVTRAVVSTYQAASGAGAAAMAELEQQTLAWAAGKPREEWPQEVWGRPYAFNLFSHDSRVGGDGYNQEEVKMMQETGKILHDDTVGVTATCVRVPILRAHCEDVNLTLASPLAPADAVELLAASPGVRIVDDATAGVFPEPLAAAGQDDVLVGRVRGDPSQAPGHGLSLFLAGDQLLKGAATNAVQIMELLVGPDGQRQLR